MNHMEKSTWLGLLIGFGGILAGNLMEGGHVASLMQFTAFVIVICGTIGAVLVSHKTESVSKAITLAKEAFRTPDNSKFEKSLQEILECSRIAKKDSLLAVEPYINRTSDPILQKALRNIVDGVPPEVIAGILETEIETEEEANLAAAKVWTDAGGYSPTIGIIGAVLGLIHVMGNLTDTSKLGAGIAVAFVATVYGVTFANLVYLPLGSKIKARVQEKARHKRLLVEGALLITPNLSPFVVDQKIKASVENHNPA